LEGGDGSTLPGFSVFNQDKCFIDLYNSGTGDIDWTSSVSAQWIKLSETSGRFDHERRIWASIDWALAPKGEAQAGVITLSGAGRTNQVNITIFDPAHPATNEVRGFVESHGYVSMEAEHYSRKTDRDGAGWRIFAGLGRNGSSITVLPPTVPSRTSMADILAHSPLLEYDMYLFSTGTVSVAADCIPALNINADHQRRFAVGIDDEPPQITSFQRGGSSAINNLMSLHSQHHVASRGRHTLKIWMVDPGLILDKIVINTGGVRNSYMGPPESYVNQESTRTSAKEGYSNTTTWPATPGPPRPKRSRAT
jgi:hypothetical protein